MCNVQHLGLHVLPVHQIRKLAPEKEKENPTLFGYAYRQLTAGRALMQFKDVPVGNQKGAIAVKSL